MPRTQDEIKNLARPMVAREEIVRYSPSAAIAWQNEATTRAVSLLEHDSILVGLLALRDFVARPTITGAPSARGTIVVNPYATVPYWQEATAGVAAAWREIPAVGIYGPPADAEALKWWRALDALIWRIADLSTEEAAPAAATPTLADTTPVAVFTDDTESTVTMPGVQFKEHAETVRLVRPIVAGATAYAEQQGRAAARDMRALTADELAAIAAAVVIRDQLAVERDSLEKRGAWRALGVIGGAVAIAYGYAQMM